MKICRGQIIFDQEIKPNDAGYISPSAFAPQKKDSSVFRWLVFGDSFTDGYFLETNWPSRVDSLFKSQGRSIEIHSFALNGSGIKTWARILDRLNKMHYEYDGVIIACFGNDLSREDFVMEHSGQNCYFGWQDLNGKYDSTRIQTEPDIIDSAIIQNASKIVEGKYASCCHQLLLPYYIRILYKEVRQIFVLKSQSKELGYTYIFADKNHKNTDSLRMLEKYGKEKMMIIDNMLLSCIKNKKCLLLASIPDKGGLSIYKAQDDIQLNIELKWLALKYKSAFFDGYSISKKTGQKELFLNYDGHWNQDGSDVFAQKISEAIINQSKRVQ